MTGVQSNDIRPQTFCPLCKHLGTTLRSQGIVSYPNSNNISRVWHTRNTFLANPKPIKRHQHDPLCQNRSSCHLNK